MFVGETVEVIRRGEHVANPYGEYDYNEIHDVVDDVLVHPSTTEDFGTANRPEGTTQIITLHFPKTYNVSLRHAKVIVRNTTYDVIGNPSYYTKENTPGKWNYPVQAVVHNG